MFILFNQLEQNSKKSSGLDVSNDCRIKFCNELSQTWCKLTGPGFVAMNLLICNTQRFQLSLAYIYSKI